MRDKQRTSRDVLPEDFSSLEEFWGFWETHSSADYEDDMEAVAVDDDLISSKVYCPVAKDLLSKVRTQAQRQDVLSETLVNLWLQERLGASTWKAWSKKVVAFESSFSDRTRDASTTRRSEAQPR